MIRRRFLQIAGAGCLAHATAQAGELQTDNGLFLDQDRLQSRNGNRSTVACQQGIVCSSQPLASQAGRDILQA